MDVADFEKEYTNITFLKIQDEKCIKTGYINTSYITLKKRATGWDKALYYFGVENTTFEFIWFIEDDVFFYNEDTLLQIDNNYNKDDLLSAKYIENKESDKKWGHWNKIDILDYTSPFYRGMMCVVRFSKMMMTHINEYAAKHKTLFFLEVLFPTLAIKKEAIYSSPKEYENVHWRYTFTRKDIIATHLYHPVKKMDDHILFRSFLNGKT